MVVRRPEIIGLDWPPGREEHVEEHIHAWLVDDLIEGGDWTAYENKPEHPPTYIQIIGRTESGEWVTATLAEPSPDNPGFWRPVTAWHSTEHEKALHRKYRKQFGRG